MPGERDWRKYNEALVRRGELDIDPSVLEDWGRELRRANGGKIGDPVPIPPESFMGLLAFLYSGSSSTSHALGADRGGSCASSPGSWMGCRSRTTPR